MKNFSGLFKYYDVKDVLSSNKEELNNLWFNANYYEENWLKDSLVKKGENFIFLLKGKKWKDSKELDRRLKILECFKDVKEPRENIEKIIRNFLFYDRPFEFDILKNYINSKNIEKIEKLLKGLSFSEDLLIRDNFLRSMSDKGIENFRKLYGKLPKSSYAINFLNLTDDIEFLRNLPKEKTGYNDAIFQSYTFEELKKLSKETYSEDNFFQYAYDEYLYKEYEEELLEFSRENKEFLEKFSVIYLPRDIGKALKILKFCKKHDDILTEGVEKDFYRIYSLISFLNSYFTISNDEEKLVKVIEKVVEKKLNIQNLFRQNRETFKFAYVFDIILMLNNQVGVKKLEALCKYASYSGLESENLRELTKTKYKNEYISKEALKIIYFNQETVFEKTFGISTKDYRIKRKIINEVKKEDKEKVDYLLSKGYQKTYVYSYLFAIDNICYLVKNGYELEEKYFWAVKRFFTKDILDKIIEHNLPLGGFMRSTITTIEQDVEDIIKEKEGK